MPKKKKTLLSLIRGTCVAITAAVTLLAVEFLWTGYDFFIYAAGGLATAGLLLLSLMLNRWIRM